MTTAEGQLCRVCRQHVAEYTCPRCNARYCSLDCYRQHSDRCTEGFYRDAAVSELRSITASQDEKQRMLEILQRLHQQEVEGSGSSSEDEAGIEDDDGAAGLSAQTLHRLLAKMQASGGELEISAEDLSPAELAAFHRALAAGELSDAVQPWKPWWLSEEAAQLELSAAGTPLVTTVEAGEGQAQARGQGQGAPGGSGTSGSSSDTRAGHGDSEQPPAGAASVPAGASLDAGPLPPPPSRPLPPLSALTRAAPSPLLWYQLLDLLYCYCHTLRLYNGDYRWEPAEAADALFALSAVLAAVTASPPSTAGAVGSSASSGSGGCGPAVAPVLLGCLQRACQPPAGSPASRALAVGVLSDVAAVLQLGRPVVLTALIDASRLVETARQQLDGGGGGGSGSSNSYSGSKQREKELRRRLVGAERKLLFFLSWANEQKPEVYQALALAAAAEHEKHAASLGRGSGGSGTQAQPAAAGAAGFEARLGSAVAGHGSNAGRSTGGAEDAAAAGAPVAAPGSGILIQEL